MNLGIVQITSANTKRKKLLVNKIIPKCIEISGGNYTLVSSFCPVLKEAVEQLGGTFSEYTAWERDMSRKWRQGLKTRQEEWVCFLADDILPDDNWLEEMKNYLSSKEPGQYGFRLTDENGKRHEFGEDWMQFPEQTTQAQHRPLSYDVDTGAIEESLTAYVANCVCHKDVLAQVEPFGLFQLMPDVMWSLAIRECGFPISFNPKARAYHLGSREDNR
tara:strand:- start:785 stop:1438 length:654 start_codon:yes stop_codon:yes gene_type:complete